MKTSVRTVAISLFCLLAALPMFAVVPTRGSSRNGVDSIAQLWNLFGPTEVRTLTKGTTTVNYKQQVVCPNQDAASVVNPGDTLHSGTCEGGNGNLPSYLFIFQLRSSATNVTVQLGNLVGFIPDSNAPTFGVILCDDANTLELCTTATVDQLPNMTFTANGTNTTETIFIPSFPKFPNGKRHQGQGLTIFVLTKQTQPNPIALPTITLK